jgi:hypothetical protein
MSKLHKNPKVDTLLIENADESTYQMPARGLWQPEVTANDVSPYRILGTYEHLRVLDLGCAVVTSMSDLADIVVADPKLTRFRAFLYELHYGLRHVYELPSSRLSEMLLPLKDTLQSLEVHRPPVCTRRTRPITPLDFSAFTELTTLRVSSTTWFEAFKCSHWSTQGFVWDLEVRKGLHKLLPPYVKTLEIDFAWPSTALFARGPAHPAQFLVLSASSQVKGFDWIEQLLQTRIRHVRLVDSRHNCNGRAKGKQFRVGFKPSCVMQDKSDAAGVELDIQLLN